MILATARRKGRCQFTKAGGDDELNNKGHQEAEDNDLRTAIHQILTEIALCQAANPGVGDGETKPKSRDPIELPGNLGPVAVGL